MANFSDGGPLPADTEDVFSDGIALSSAGSMRQYLQSLLDSKEKQLQQAGTLGQRVLAQQMELEERVRQLQDIGSEKAEDDEVSSEMRLRYRDLANTLKVWEEENTHLSSAFGNTDDFQPQPSPILPLPDLPQDLPPHGPSAPSASQSRRAKNAAHRANDVEFAFEIGSSLLTEVRRLQSLLAERDKAVQDMKEEKDDLEKAVDSLQTALRTQEQSTDKFKEENWNLEVSLQEMRAQLSNVHAAAQRGEAETKRLTKVLTSTRESNDSYKNEVERLKSAAEEMKTKHETDVALHRKHVAALAREKSDLQQSIDKYKVELARASRHPLRFGSPYTPDGRSDAQTPRMLEDDDDPFGPGTTGMGMSTNRRRLDTSALFPPDAFGPESVDNSPEPSPSRPFLAPNHPSNEIEALQQKLAHAQRQISTLKGTLGREKELRMEYRRRMIEGGVLGDRLDDDDDEDGVEDGEEAEEATEEGEEGAVGAIMLSRGNGNGRLTLAQKLGLSAQSPSSDLEDDDAEPLDTSDNFTSTIIPETSTDDLVEADRSIPSVRPPSPLSPGESPSNRTSVVSVDGMDPAFANVLRRAPSVTSVRRGVNPVIRGGMRSGRAVAGRRRGGTAYQEPRPSSLVGAPEALAAELGIGNTSVGMQSVMEVDIPDIEERDMKEFACQTENEEPPIAAIVLAPELKQPEIVKPETVEMGIQVELAPEPEPVPVPVEEPAVVKVESSMQTEEVPRMHASVATDPHVPPVLVNSSTSTEPSVPVPTAEMEIQTELEPEFEPESSVQPEVVQEVIARPQTPMRSEAETQTTPRSETFPTSPIRALSGLPARRVRYLSSASTATAVPRTALHQIVQSEDEDAQTELAYASSLGENEYTPRTEPETETDLDDYQDARSAAPTPSALDSLNDNVNDDDFHSMSTMTDNEFSSDEDEDADVGSVKASIMNAGGPSSRASRATTAEEEEVLPRLVITYESQAIETDPLEEEPKRVLSEISIQTDEWQPPPPPIIPLSQPSSGFGLYRVGPNSQQFQFVSPPSAPQTAASTPVSPHPPFSSPAPPLHESTNISARPLRFSSPSLPIEVDKIKSTEFAPSGLNIDAAQRQHTQSLVPAASPVDKTRPPTMMLPPPPKMPPPPNSMPPPSFIPEKRRPPSALSSHREMPPPRPSSPPPPELIQRATTPTFGSVLTVPGRGMSGSRQHGSSLPPLSVLRQPLSTNSFRSASNAAVHAQMSSSSGGHFNDSRDRNRRLQSATSLLSDQEDAASHRSSLSSDFHPRAPSEDHVVHAAQNVPTTPNRTANVTASTDPAIIHSITQTMIGEFLYKYTRRNFGKGHGERRHKRFFWVHPYTRTLYWSSADPGSTNVTEQSAKSAYIDSVRAVLDPNPMPPGLYQYSVVVSTPQREMKLTAPTKERHEIWLNALQYLLARPAPTGVAQSPTTQVNGAPVTPMRHPNGNGNVLDQSGVISPMSQRSGRSERSGMSNDSPWNITPRGGRRSRSRVSMGGSVGKRSGTPAAEYLRWADGPTSPSLRGFEQTSRGMDADEDEDLDFEIHDTTTSDQEGFEGLENGCMNIITPTTIYTPKAITTRIVLFHNSLEATQYRSTYSHHGLCLLHSLSVHVPAVGRVAKARVTFSPVSEPVDPRHLRHRRKGDAD
ncbi:hypothetical protein EW145_g2179 [Phellinidium pouzarii]|uniref:PH domain-containing protein n=1 Tax=Phellinidium pouzarii TaxID=167371 RepID=A0A4S4LBW8_9AGAM|nr:hypothetical protein EW145_g2179 [Phellinidium pouzarii]